MLKFEQNSKIIKFTTLKYLYEIAAIPFNIRDEYLQKLLNCPKTEIKRKNSTNQKNVRLLEMINEYIKNDNMVEWNDEIICRQLNISKNMLYCHKHYIIKGLRKFFFNWNEIEKETFKKSEINKNSIEYKFESANKMYEVGLTREAKTEFLKISGLLEKMETKNIEHSIMLLKIYDKLYGYYHYQNNRYKFNIYGKKIENLNKTLLKSKKIKNDKKLALEINILLNRYMLKKISFRVGKQKEYFKIIDIYKIILSDAKKIRDTELAYKMYVNLGVIHQDLLHFNIAKTYYEKGLKLALKFNMRQESINCLISITAVEYLLGQLSLNDCLDKMNDLYVNFKNTNLQKFIQERSLFQFVFITTATDRNDLLNKYLEKYNSFKIITYGYKAAIRMLYYMKFTYYLSKITEYDYRSIYNKPEKSIIVKGIRQDIIEKLEDLEIELLSNFDNKYLVFFKLEALLFMLEAEFWKGKFMNYNKIMSIFQKIDWLLKTRRKLFQLDNELFETIEIIKTCTKIIEESEFIKDIKLINKYGEKFDKFIENLPNKNKENIISGFTILSYTAEQSGCKKIRDDVNKLYFKLEEKFSGIFSSIKKQIENGKNKKFKAIRN